MMEAGQKALFAGLAVLALAVPALVIAEGKEEKVLPEALPAAVRATVDANLNGGKVTEAEIEEENGQKVFSVEIKAADGSEVEFEIAPDGKLLKTEKEGPDGNDSHDGEGSEKEQKLGIEQAPEPVRNAINTVLRGQPLDALTVEKERGVTLYEAEYKVEGVEHSVELAADGEVLEQENAVTTSSLPNEVTAAFAKRFPGAAVSEAELVTQRFYELEVKVNGKTREVKINAAGQILGGGKDDDDDEDDD